MTDIVERLRRTAAFIGNATGKENARWVTEAADRIEELEAAAAYDKCTVDFLKGEKRSAVQSEEFRYARDLLVSFVNEHCDPVPEWKPNDDLLSILIQFDNALTVVRSIKAGFDPKRPGGVAQAQQTPPTDLVAFLNAAYDAIGDLGVDNEGNVKWAALVNIQREIGQKACDLAASSVPSADRETEA